MISGSKDHEIRHLALTERIECANVEERLEQMCKVCKDHGAEHVEILSVPGSMGSMGWLGHYS